MATLAGLLLASCTSATDPLASVAAPGYAANGSTLSVMPSGQQAAAADSATPGPPQTLMSAEGDTPLPEQVAFAPTGRPDSEAAQAELSVPAAPGSQEIADSMPQALESGQATPQQAAVPQGGADTALAQKPASVPAEAAYAAPAPQPTQKKSFLAALFGAPAKPPAAAAPPKPLVETEVAANTPPLVDTDPARAAVQPVIQLASAEPGQPLFAPSADNGLPGVRRQTALFEITRKSGSGDDSDVDVNEDEGGSSGAFQVAYAAGLARLAPNGLLKQNESVDVACLKPSLVRVLKTIEGHFGRKIVVTSGFRDPSRNMRARGAKNSLHMYCAAADIEIPGVSKWDLANYARSMPGRGGVGTYCYTDAVHVDVGPERDWNWRCRRRR